MKALRMSIALLAIFGMLFVTSCDDTEEPIVAEAKITEFIITNAGANGDASVTGVVGEDSITIEVVYETDVTALVPEITATEGATVTPATGVAQDFTTSRVYVVKNGSVTKTYTVTVEKAMPSSGAVESISFSNATGTDYVSEVKQGEKEIEVKVYSGFSKSVKINAETLVLIPATAAYELVGADADGYVDLTSDATLNITYGGEVTAYTVKAADVAIGADFANANVLANLTGAAIVVPVEIAENTSRDAHSANGIVYVPARDKIYYWIGTDVKSGITTPNELSLDGIDLGSTTWGLSSVDVVGDHVFVASMANAKDKHLKVWHWTNKDATPELILDYTVIDPEGTSTAVRLGDCFSVNLDASGNGELMFSNFPYQNKQNQVYKFDVAAYSATATPSIFSIGLPTGEYTGQYARLNNVAGTDQYTVTGAEMGIALMNADGTLAYTVGTDVIQGRAQDARIVEFNQARYLVYTVNREWEKGGAFYEVVDITEGATTQAALEALTPENIASKIVNTFSIGDPSVADVWVSATSSASIVDGKLQIFAYSTLNGFTLREFAAQE